MDEMQSAPVTPVVSVLIVSFNCVEPLRRCLSALEKSEAREQVEIIVVDNGSRDGSARIDEEFENVTVMRLPKYFGGTRARNVGVRTAKGDYIFFLAPQVEVQPVTVRLLAERMASTTYVGGVSPLLVDGSGRALPQIHPLPDVAALSEAASGGWPASPVPPGDGPYAADYPDWKALMVRRQAILGMNYLDERFGEYWADADLCWKLRKAGKKIHVFRDLPVIDHGEEGLWTPARAGQADVFLADRAIGAANFASKHLGVVTGMTLRLGIALKALFTLQLSKFSRLLSGQTIDGNEPIG
jgi:hypothetical protein